MPYALLRNLNANELDMKSQSYHFGKTDKLIIQITVDEYKQLESTGLRTPPTNMPLFKTRNK